MPLRETPFPKATVGLVCKQLPCWSSEWAVLSSSIFVSGVPCAKPKSTKAYLKRHKFRIRSHKVSINHSLYYSLLIYLSFAFHSMLLNCTVASITVPFYSFSYCPIIPIPSMFLPYTSVHRFSSQIFSSASFLQKRISSSSFLKFF